MRKLTSSEVLARHNALAPAATTLLDTAGQGKVSSPVTTKAGRDLDLHRQAAATPRSAIATRIQHLKAKMDTDDQYIRNLVSRGEYLKAIERLQYQVALKAELQTLATEYAAIVKAAATPAKDAAPRSTPSKHRVIVKPKRYKMFSEK